jgi:hypothetical protein
MEESVYSVVYKTLPGTLSGANLCGSISSLPFSLKSFSVLSLHLCLSLSYDFRTALLVVFVVITKHLTQRNLNSLKYY